MVFEVFDCRGGEVLKFMGQFFSNVYVILGSMV